MGWLYQSTVYPGHVRGTSSSPGTVVLDSGGGTTDTHGYTWFTQRPLGPDTVESPTAETGHNVVLVTASRLGPHKESHHLFPGKCCESGRPVVEVVEVREGSLYPPLNGLTSEPTILRLQQLGWVIGPGGNGSYK